MRDNFWQRRDFSQRFAAIRFVEGHGAAPPDGLRVSDWGEATRGLVETGEAFVLGIQATIAEQADWLQRVNPGYIQGYPSAMRALANHLADNGHRLANLREVCTFGEILEPECRAACDAAWHVPVVDVYSSQEVGYIALQCQAHAHYHVQAEHLFVEVLDEGGNPCAPGQVGRVVISTLHNFAMPLLRYDIGDFAEVGEPCDCGRGLPVLKRVLGRQRNMLVLPNGDRRWPALGQGEDPEKLPPFYQCQVVQRSLSLIEVKVVRPIPLSPAEVQIVTKYMRQTLQHPFEVTITYVDSIPRSPSGKFEDFVSDVT